MYTKEELESMAVPELMGIAKELGVKVKQSDSLETVVYAILDKAAEASASGTEAPKRKRTRILKKDTSRVYSVNGKEGENYDVKSKRKPAEQPSLFSDAPIEKPEKKPAEELQAEEEPQAEAPKTEEQPKPKKRGRKSKAEIAAEAAAAEVNEQAEEIPQEQPAEAPVPEAEVVADFIPEESFDSMSTPEGEEEKELIEQLKQKMERTRTSGAEVMAPAEEDGVWPGDPGDGTDFITVLDIPIEDQAAIPTLDMFDRPVAQQQYQEEVSFRTQDSFKAKYDFTDVITGNGVLEILADGYGFIRSSA